MIIVEGIRVHMNEFTAISTGEVRKSIQILIEKEGFKLLGQEREIYLAFRDCQLKSGGNQNSLLFIESTLYPEIRFYISDPKIWKNKILSERFVDEFKKHQNSSFKNLLTISSILILFLLPIFSLFFFRAQIIHKIADQIPPEEESKLGDKIWEIFKKDKSIITSKYSLTVEKELLSRLKYDPNFKIKIHIVEDSIVNAFALPGGHIILNSGLILKADTPEEIAGVLSHEISHITNRHVLRQMIQMIGIYGGLSILVGDIGGVVATVLQGSAFFLQMRFSQEFEKEADSQGIKILEKSEISPSGLKLFLEKIKKKEDDSKIIDDQEKVLEFFQTHPNTEDRIKFIETWSKNHPNFKGKPFLFSFNQWKNDIKNSGDKK
jgi:predicted Zn-dependent protease